MAGNRPRSKTKKGNNLKEKKHRRTDPSSTLITLDQLSQTIEVMTNVVNRLREHLSEQVLQNTSQDTKNSEDNSEGNDLSAVKETKTSVALVAQELSETIQKINEKSIVIELRNESYAKKDDDPTTLH